MVQASVVAAAVFVTMAACNSGWESVARENADVERGEGGIWVTGDGGTVWFMPSDPFKRPLRATPTLEKLCMLRDGNLTGEERSPGIWIGDIPTVLGRPNDRAQHPEDAQVTYIFAPPRVGDGVVAQRSGGVTSREVTLTLSFERMEAVWSPVSERVPMDDPYFLTRIDASGIEVPKCWQPHATNRVTPCDECKQRGRDFVLCTDVVDDGDECYAR